MMIKTYLLLLLLSVFVVPGSSYAGGFMSGEELETKLSGKTADGYHLKKDYAFTNYFAPDGILHSIREGEPRKANWRINDKGYHCVKWEDRYKEFCRPFKDNGDGSISKYKLKGSKEIKILTLKNFRDGNQLPK